jgi:hypothetical protein
MQSCTSLRAAAPTRAPAPARRSALAVRAFGPGNEMKDGVEAGTRVKVTAPIKVRLKRGRAKCVCPEGRVGPSAERACLAGELKEGQASERAPTRSEDKERHFPSHTRPCLFSTHVGLPRPQDGGVEH